MTSVAAMISGLVFFGYGFDLTRKTALQVWHLKSLLTAVMIVLNNYGYLLNLNTLTICMCHCAGTGGMLFFMAWLMQNCQRSSLATASAFFTLLGVSTCAMALFMGFFANSIFPSVLLFFGVIGSYLIS